MWINIEIVSQDNEVLYLPKQMMKQTGRNVRVHFGKKTALARVLPLELEEAKEAAEVVGSASEGDVTNDNPIKVRFSDKLADRLLLYPTLKYQVKLNYETITIGPVIGLLLGNHSYAYDPQHLKKYTDRLGVYEKIGGLIYAFSAEAVDWEDKSIYGLYYNPSNSRWIYGKFPIPSVIYRRDFHSKSPNIKKLIEVTNHKMFNSWRFTKFYLYNYVKRNGELLKHLPPTSLCVDYNQVKRFIDRNENVILKPISLSRGRGICIINKIDGVYTLLDYRYKAILEISIADDNALKEFFERNTDLFKDYLIQKHLRLAKVDGSPYDIRVVMQKERPDEWKCSGIECRVAAKKLLLTNISRGGYALTIDEALKSSFQMTDEQLEEKKKQLNSLCLKLCKHLDRMGHHFSEFGMDIAIDEEGNFWIIEVNVFPSFKGFKTMDYKTYLNIRYTPILYAAYLAGFRYNTKGRGENHELLIDNKTAPV